MLTPAFDSSTRKEDGPMTVGICEVFRAVFYAPLYAAIALGNFEKEGLDVRLSTSPKPEALPRLLLDEKVEIGCGGPMAVMLSRDQDPDSDLVIFCATVQKDPFFLVGREPQSSFTFADLKGKTFAPMTESPTPWLLLKDDLKEAGISVDELSLAAPSTTQENIEKFRRGEIDVIQIPEPFVSQLVSEGLGHVWYSGAERGDVGFSALYTTKRTAEKSPQMLGDITAAVHDAQKWLAAAPVADIAKVLQPFLPECPGDIIEKCVERYRQYDVWGTSPLIAQQSYEKLRGVCVSGGLFKRETPYNTACMPEFAQQAVAQPVTAPKTPHP